MKLLSLNVWGGKEFEPLIAFLKLQAEEVDIFCFQEVFHHGKPTPGHDDGKSRMEFLTEVGELLPRFDGFSAPQDAAEERLATFVRKKLAVQKADYIFVQGSNSARTHGIPLHYIQFKNVGKLYTICNFHGWWNPGSKGDTPERIEQSKRVKTFLDSVSGAKILCGDFNLRPGTESLSILEKDMTNLIKTYNITTTRSPLYMKSEKYADYTLVSPEIQVKNFQVLQNVVSDHLPMILEFS